KKITIHYLHLVTMQKTCLEIVRPPLHHILPSCQAAMVTSGTATLEVALCQTPMVIIYKANWMTYCLGRCLIKLDKIGLCNIVADKFISKELIQHRATPQAIADEIGDILTNENYRTNMITDFIAMRAQLDAAGDTHHRAAEVVLKMLMS